MVGPGRLELPTSRLSGVRSNHLSYGPILGRTHPKAGPCLLKKEKRGRREPPYHPIPEGIPWRIALRSSPDWCDLCSKKHGKVHPRQVSASYQFHSFLRKEVIQPQVPLRLPCYDFTPVADPTVVACFPCGLAQRLRVKPTPMV